MLDDEIKNNLKKCVRCGLCLKNCPIYEIKSDENNTSRGLICKLSGYEDNKLTKKEISKDLKICLFCSKCSKNCPSKVDTTKIFAYKNALLNPSFISQRLFLIIKLLPLKILYFLNFLKLNKKYKTNSKIAYFKGCVSKAQHKYTYLDKIFSNPDFECCAMPYFYGGDLKNYNKAKEKNIELIKKYETVVFDCASCKKAVLEYPELNENEKKKLIFITDFLKEKKFKIKNSKYKNIVFHRPCHLDDNDFKNIENFLSNIKGINYIKLEKEQTCCGFGGSYFMFHPLISLKIALKKADIIKKSKADLILTCCPSCTLGIRFNQLISFNFSKTLELRDFIDKELQISE